MMAETNGEKKISKEDQTYYEKTMKNVECPFTWEMSELKNIEIKYELYDNEEVIPLMKFMRYIVHVYDYTRTNKDLQTILEKLNDCDNVIIEIQKIDHPEISIEAVLSVFKATKYFVFLHFKMEPELKQIIAETGSIDSSEKKQTSTIKACKSIAWSIYSQTAEAIKFIREAIADNPNCDLWYFILGKILRSKRRDPQIHAELDAQEIESFEIAYNMMKNPVFGVYLGRAYNEQRKNDKFEDIIERVLPDMPQNDALLLMIALAYIKMKDFQKAKYCLDKVENKSHTQYLHYTGIYYSRQKKIEESRPYFEEAIKGNNYEAEYDYMHVMQRIQKKEFDLTQHLLQMLDKYENRSEHVRQTIISHLAYTYFRKDKKIEESLKYFLKAIEINPDSMFLEEPYKPIYLFWVWPDKNIYTILSQDVLPTVCGQPRRFDKKTVETAGKLMEYCNKHAK